MLVIESFTAGDKIQNQLLQDRKYPENRTGRQRLAVGIKGRSDSFRIIDNRQPGQRFHLFFAFRGSHGPKQRNSTRKLCETAKGRYKVTIAAERKGGRKLQYDGQHCGDKKAKGGA